MKSLHPAAAVLASTLWIRGAIGATAVFTPTGPSHVPHGDAISFNIVVSAAAGGFNSADIVIGSTDAADLSFVYSSAWITAFSNVSPISYDNGFFAQDVFSGGNHSVSVGTTLALGTVTVDTTGMSVGTHSITINHAVDGISTLGLAGTPEPLAGTVNFQVTPPVPAASTWGLVVLSLGIGILGTLTLRKGFE